MKTIHKGRIVGLFAFPPVNTMAILTIEDERRGMVMLPCRNPAASRCMKVIPTYQTKVVLTYNFRIYRKRCFCLQNLPDRSAGKHGKEPSRSCLCLVALQKLHGKEGWTESNQGEEAAIYREHGVALNLRQMR
jgi:hypothetical protein